MSALLHEEIVAQALAELPNECCGLLGGTVEQGLARVSRRYPLVNAAASPRRYEGHPREMFLAFKDMRARGLDLVAIYHSHPTSEPVPSRTDLDVNGYGEEVIHLIVSLRSTPAVTRGWSLAANDYREVAWVLSEDKAPEERAGKTPKGREAP